MILESKIKLRAGVFIVVTAIVIYMFCLQASVRLSVTLGSTPGLGVSFEMRHYTRPGTRFGV